MARKNKGKSGPRDETPPDLIDLPFSLDSFVRILRDGARADGSYTHQQIADWSDRFCQEVMEGSLEENATPELLRAADIALDVDAQWELFLVNTYSPDELQSIDFEAVRLPEDWFQDWLRKLGPLPESG